MANPYLQVSRDAQRALEEFSSEFDQALALAEPITWARDFGLYNVSNAIQTTYPLPISAAGYKERKGDDKLRRLYERSLSMQTKEWYDGVEEKKKVVEAPDFIGWAGEPSRIAREGARQPNLMVAAMLHANPLLDFYTVKHEGGNVASTIRLFATNHPVNIFDDSIVSEYQGTATFSNLKTATEFGEALFDDVTQDFLNRPGPNGRPMGLAPTHVLAPTALAKTARKYLEADNLLVAVTNQAGSENVGGVMRQNFYKGAVELVVCPELQDSNMVYFVDANASAFPWILQDGGAPEEIRYDESDAKYKDEGKIAVKYILEMGVAAALPHAIQRYTIG